MTKKQENIFTYLCMNTLMCVCMSAAAMLVEGEQMTVSGYLVSLGEALVICNISTYLFRIPELCSLGAEMLAGRRLRSWAFSFWVGVLNATGNTICMTTFMTLIHIGFHKIYFIAWIHAFPILEIVSVAVSLLTSPWMRKLVGKIK